MNADKKVPEVRFKGFSGEWIQETISNIAPLQRGFDLPKNLIKAGTHPVVMSNGVNGFHNTFKAKAPGVVTGRSGTIGNIHYIEVDYWPHNTSLWVTNFHKNEPLFIYYLYVKLDLKRFGTGSGVPTLNRNDVHVQSVALPKDSKEQTQIGNYFQKLDALINQHQQKHDKLNNIKKAMLDKMFPKQGETIPEIRFNGFSGEWEEKKIFDEAIVTTGFPFDSAEFSSSGDYLVITNGNIQNNSADVDGKTGNRIASDKITCLSQYILNIGDILITMDGSVGRTAKVIETHQILAQRVGRLVAKNNTEFLYQSLNTGAFLEAMTTISHGGTIKHISLSEIGNYVLLVPKYLEEQVKIGSYLKKLDELIAQHQQQITKLNNIKQACLSKMFV